MYDIQRSCLGRFWAGQVHKRKRAYSVGRSQGICCSSLVATLAFKESKEDTVVLEHNSRELHVRQCSHPSGCGSPDLQKQPQLTAKLAYISFACSTCRPVGEMWGGYSCFWHMPVPLKGLSSSTVDLLVQHPIWGQVLVCRRTSCIGDANHSRLDLSQVAVSSNLQLRNTKQSRLARPLICSSLQLSSTLRRDCPQRHRAPARSARS